ncbi:hypothetical protein FACS189414_2330 [Bacteroidia bacterium]|nr:hypothetical protein FACS189414_2330 [Bacteroidia bacterium]
MFASSQASSISVYPNLVENMLNVELNRDVRNGTLALFDLNGKASPAGRPSSTFNRSAKG